MQIVNWRSWLDQHIPYYEQGRQLDQWADRAPQCVLIVDPRDRNNMAEQHGFAGSTWEAMNTRIADLDFEVKPLFLSNDTHQRWYWGFWDEQEAFLAVLQLS